MTEILSIFERAIPPHGAVNFALGAVVSLVLVALVIRLLKPELRESAIQAERIEILKGVREEVQKSRDRIDVLEKLRELDSDKLISLREQIATLKGTLASLESENAKLRVENTRLQTEQQATSNELHLMGVANAAQLGQIEDLQAKVRALESRTVLAATPLAGGRRATDPQGGL